ncbi:MAG TPA: hypothetical protein EYH09_01830 [Candidatus Nanopusillus sp.]|nr:hypothetical protein [Candidatus Nanopusillus sp.]
MLINKIIEKIHKYLWPVARKLKPHFKDLKEDILFINWRISYEDYLVIIVFSVISAFISTFVISTLVLYFILNYIDFVLITLSLIYAIIVSFMVFMYFLCLPRLAKADYIKEIEDNLPLFLLYFYGLVSSGVNLVKAIEISARREEFGKLSKDIRFLHYLIDSLGYDLLSALMILANKTPSQRFKEFLYELVSVIRSGGDIKQTVREIAREALVDYEIKLRSFIEKTNLLLTIYTFLFIAFPLVLLILAFLFSVAIGSTEIISSLLPFFLGFIPMAYIIYLYIIFLIQPSL